MATLKLTAVNGIGDLSAAKLTAQGIETVQELAAASPEHIAKITGFPAARAAAIKDAASARLGDGVEERESRKPAAMKRDKGKKKKDKKKGRKRSRKGGGKKDKKKDRKKKDKGGAKKGKKKDRKKKGGKQDKKKSKKKSKKKGKNK